MKRIAVSGGLGFIGAEFVNLLLKQNIADEIVLIDKCTYAANIDRITDPWDDRIELKRKDICAVTEKDLYGCEYIVNFAAETHVDNSIFDGRPFVRSNVEGVFNLLELARKVKGLKKFIQISTDEVYGDMGNSTVYAATEGHPLRPSSYYSATKTSADLLVLAANRTYGLPYLITRSCNNFGPGQDKEKLLPKIFHNIANNIPIPVYGDGRQVREWISVEDNVALIAGLMLMDSIVNMTVNIGSGNRYRNIKILEIIEDILGREVIIKYVDDRLGHDTKYALDSSRLRDMFPSFVFTPLEVYLKSEVDKICLNQQS